MPLPLVTYAILFFSIKNFPSKFFSQSFSIKDFPLNFFPHFFPQNSPLGILPTKFSHKISSHKIHLSEGFSLIILLSKFFPQNFLHQKSSLKVLLSKFFPQNFFLKLLPLKFFTQNSSLKILYSKLLPQNSSLKIIHSKFFYQSSPLKIFSQTSSLKIFPNLFPHNYTH